MADSIRSGYWPKQVAAFEPTRHEDGDMAVRRYCKMGQACEAAGLAQFGEHDEILMQPPRELIEEAAVQKHLGELDVLDLEAVIRRNLRPASLNGGGPSVAGAREAAEAVLRFLRSPSEN